MSRPSLSGPENPNETAPSAKKHERQVVPCTEVKDKLLLRALHKNGYCK